MSRQQRITKHLMDALAPSTLIVEDETHRHSVPTGSESHFKLLIVSSHFESLARLARYRLVHELLQEELQQGLHALSLQLYTPEEWSNNSTDLRTSPNCKGGSREKLKDSN